MKKSSGLAVVGVLSLLAAGGAFAAWKLRGNPARVGLRAAPRDAMAVAWVDQSRLRAGSIQTRVQRFLERTQARTQQRSRLAQACGTDPLRDAHGTTFVLLPGTPDARSWATIVATSMNPGNLGRCLLALAGPAEPGPASTVHAQPIAPVGGHLAFSLQGAGPVPLELAALSDAVVLASTSTLARSVAVLDGAPSAHDNPVLRAAAESVGPGATLVSVADLSALRSSTPELTSAAAMPVVGSMTRARWVALGIASQGESLTLRLRLGYEGSPQAQQALSSLQGGLSLARMFALFRLSQAQSEWGRYMAPRAVANPALAAHISTGQEAIALAGQVLNRLQPQVQGDRVTLDLTFTGPEVDTLEHSLDAAAALAASPEPEPPLAGPMGILPPR